MYVSVCPQNLKHSTDQKIELLTNLMHHMPDQIAAPAFPSPSNNDVLLMYMPAPRISSSTRQGMWDCSQDKNKQTKTTTQQQQTNKFFNQLKLLMPSLENYNLI